MGRGDVGLPYFNNHRPLSPGIVHMKRPTDGKNLRTNYLQADGEISPHSRANTSPQHPVLPSLSANAKHET